MTGFVGQYGEWKRQIGEQLGASEALIHVHVGLAIFFMAALVLRRRMASPLPVSFVAVLAVGNEVVDFLGPTPSPPLEAAADYLNTVFWPIVLFLLARRGRASRTKV